MSRHIFLPLALSLYRDILCYVETFFLGFFSTFIVTIFSFVATEFLTIACCCCRDRHFLCLDKVLLSCIVETKLYVATDSEDVVTYFLL